VGETKADTFVSTDPEVEVDAETAAAIKAADEGRVVTLDEAEERMRQWLFRSSSQNPR